MPNPAKEVPLHKGKVGAYKGWNCTLGPNRCFDATLKVTGFGRGRSSVKVYVRPTGGDEKYEMFMTDFVDVLMERGWARRGVKGSWTWCKRGTNYGLYRFGDVGERPEEDD